jgi:multidrug efflux pump subunit AcrA (membrane-fusion protein)
MSKVTGQSLAKRRNRRIGAGIVLAGAVAGGVVLAVARDAGTGTTARLVTVAADRGAVTLDVATTGTVEPATTRSLAFEAGGVVESIAVQPGRLVRKGEVLARLDDADAVDDVGDAHTRLATARHRLDSAERDGVAATASATACAVAALPEARVAMVAEETIEEETAGDGRTVNGVPIAAAVAVAALNGAPMPDVGGPLVEPGPAATGDRRTAPGVRKTATGTAIGTAAATGTAATAGPCATRGYDGTGSDHVLTAEQAVNDAELTLAQAEQALGGTVIRAPISGTVVSIAGRVGDNVKAGSAFIGLADTYDMQVAANFPEADAGSLATGQSGTVTPAGADLAYPATVIQVDPVGASDGTLVRYGVLLSFAEAPSDLLVGQSAQVQVRTGERTAVLRVPSTAVHDITGANGTVRTAGGSGGSGGAGDRTVTVGLRGDRYTEITGGLSEGEHVVRSW